MGNICELDVFFDGEFGVEQKANANLIAAAPDMYAMIEALSGFNCPCEYMSESELEAFDRIETLLKKARGE